MEKAPILNAFQSAETQRDADHQYYMKQFVEYLKAHCWRTGRTVTLTNKVVVIEPDDLEALLKEVIPDL